MRQVIEGFPSKHATLILLCLKKFGGYHSRNVREMLDCTLEYVRGLNVALFFR